MQKGIGRDQPGNVEGTDLLAGAAVSNCCSSEDALCVSGISADKRARTRFY